MRDVGTKSAKLDALAIDNFTGLASIAMKKRELGQAESYASEISEWINQNGVDGIEYPIRVYLTIADILSEANNQKRSTVILQEANTYLKNKAAKISDVTAQQSFLENVPLHKTLQNRIVAYS